MFAKLPLAAVNLNPVESVSTQLVVVTSAAVEFKARYGSVEAVMPRAESQTYQSPVVLVALMRTNLAPPVKPQLMVCAAPVPV